MAVEILDRWAPIIVGVDLVTASRGTFLVTADGQRVFDKAELKRFPEPGELAQRLQAEFGPPISWRKSRSAS